MTTTLNETTETDGTTNGANESLPLGELREIVTLLHNQEQTILGHKFGEVTDDDLINHTRKLYRLSGANEQKTMPRWLVNHFKIVIDATPSFAARAAMVAETGLSESQLQLDAVIGTIANVVSKIKLLENVASEINPLENVAAKIKLLEVDVSNVHSVAELFFDPLVKLQWELCVDLLSALYDFLHSVDPTDAEYFTYIADLTAAIHALPYDGDVTTTPGKSFDAMVWLAHTDFAKKTNTGFQPGIIGK